MPPRVPRGSGPTAIQRSREKRNVDKALYAEYGAGKSKVQRPFFDLSTEDEQAIEEELGRRLDLNIRKDGG